MTHLEYFLKVLAKEGYPNPSVDSIAKMLDYDLNDFLRDLKDVLGERGVTQFCEKAVHKLSGEKGIRVDLSGPNNDEFCYIHIYPIAYDEDESENDVISNHGWGESRILSTDPETGEADYLTIQEVIENTDMGGWGELDELLDHIKSEAYNIVYNNCGFGIWWT